MGFLSAAKGGMRGRDVAVGWVQELAGTVPAPAAAGALYLLLNLKFLI